MTGFDWAQVCGRRSAVMGIVNVTPDSFSDGGRYWNPDAAVEHGLELAAAGADVLDVGGESTRPGAEPVDAGEELRRVGPVIERLAAETAIPISIDTTKAEVASAALAAGAVVVNDVSAGRHDPEILAVAAERRAGFIAMHMQGEPRTMQHAPYYDDVVVEVGDFLVGRLDAARAAGVADDALCADPGIGFGKTVEHNLALLARLSEVAGRVGVPLLVGTSRKTFVGRVVGRATGATDLATEEREEGSLATVVWAVEHGASIVRVHDVAPVVSAVRLLEVLKDAAA